MAYDLVSRVVPAARLLVCAAIASTGASCGGGQAPQQPVSPPEEALEAAVEFSDFGPFDALMRALSRPYEEQPEVTHLSEPPPTRAPYRTFCGT